MVHRRKHKVQNFTCAVLHPADRANSRNEVSRREPGDWPHDAGLRFAVAPSVERDFEAGAAVVAPVVLDVADEELAFGQLSAHR